MDDLRVRLRRETAEAHERLDLAVSVFGMETSEGRAALLEALTGGYRAVLGLRYAPVSKAREIAARPLIALGEMPAESVDAGPEIDESAAAYVFVGSHLGMQVLTTAWEQATGRMPPPPLGMPPMASEWQDVRSRLSGMPATGAVADRVVADAIRLFEPFHTGVIGARRSRVRAA